MSVLVRASVKWIFPVLLLMSLYFWLRGHNDPGGGFIAGLVLGAGLVMRYIAHPGDPSQYRVCGLRPLQISGLGLLLAVASGLLGPLEGRPFMSGVWHFEVWLPVVGNSKFGTPFYFDTGVYLVVIGVVLQAFLSIEESEWNS